MLTGHFRGALLGCGTDVWRLWEEVRAGLPMDTFLESESAMIRSRGHCNTMGTASTMACLAEALGTTIPGVAGTPAPDSRLLEQAHQSGRLAVELVAADRRPSTFPGPGSFRNAIVALAAIGGSTNGVVHLLALAGRLGVDLTFEDFDRIAPGAPAGRPPAGRAPPDGRLPPGRRAAGGAREVADLLDPDARTVTGRPLVEHLEGAELIDPEVIRSRDRPLQEAAGIAVLRGNPCPDGAVIKPAAASPGLPGTGAGPWCSTASRTSTPASTTRPWRSTRPPCWCCGAAGPGATRACPRSATCPAHPAAGARRPRHGPDQRRLHERYRAWHRGPPRRPWRRRRRPLALVRTGDPIVLDVGARTLHLDLPPGDLACCTPPEAATAAYAPASGWQRSTSTTSQADRGADLDFLVGRRRHEVTRESHRRRQLLQRRCNAAAMAWPRSALPTERGAP